MRRRATLALRAMAAHEDRTAMGLFALVVLIYLWPVLVGGGMLAPLTGLYYVTPWQAFAPHDIADYTNLALEDALLTLYPWSFLAREMIHSGTFPAWNPHAFGGTPFFANPEVAWLSPFSLPLWTLPLNYGLGVAAALKLWMAGVGSYLLVRELRLGFWPGVLAGVTFMLCAFNVVWLSHSAQVSVAVLFPWTLLLVERLIRRGRSLDGLLLAGVVAFALTGGHPGTQLHVLSAAVLYAVVRVAVSTELERMERLRRLGLIASGFAVGAMLAAVVLLPAQQAAEGTSGAFARRNGSVEFLGTRLPLVALRSALFPDWWGRVSEEVAGGPASYAERAFYAGTVALVLAVIGVVAGGAWRRKAPFLLLAAVGATVPVRLLGMAALFRHLPLFNAVQNQRILLWLLMAVTVLAAFGLQAVMDAPRRMRPWGVVGAAVLAGFVAISTVPGSGDALGGAVHYVLHRSGDVSESILALASILWWLIFVAGFAAVLLAARRWSDRPWLIGGLIALVAALDMIHFAHGYQPMGPAEKVIPPRTAAVSYLQRHREDGRIAGVETAVVNDWSTVYGLRDVRGYDQPQPSLRFYKLWRTIEPTSTPGSVFRFESLSPEALRLVGMLGGRYIVTDPGTRVRSAALSPVYRGRDATIFTNELALPRALIAERVLVAGEEQEELVGVLGERFDPRRDVVVRQDELGNVELAERREAGESVRVVDEENSRVTLRASLKGPGVVVLGDAWAPGWSVEIDGKPARALQADVLLRGVVVPAGRHEVEWSYRVPGLRAGAVLSLLGLLVVLGWGGWLVVARRKVLTGRL